MLTQQDGPVVVLTHQKPDGDALGSALALTLALQSLGQSVQVVLIPPIAQALRDFPGSEVMTVFDQDISLPNEPRRIVVVDTGATSQLGPLTPYVQRHLERTLVIDHHLSGDVISPHRLIDTQTAACCEIIAVLVDGLLAKAAPMPDETQAKINALLFLGIASDTGWFRFSNTRPFTHELAAKLLAQGVDHAAIYRRTEQCERPEKILLLARALNSLETLGHGRAALMTLFTKDFLETGAMEHETERLIDVPQQVEAYELFCLAVDKTLEAPSGQRKQPRLQTKLSFRSKPGPDAINVATLAEQFKGGGHARAAGATIDAPLAEVLPTLRQAIEQAMG